MPEELLTDEIVEAAVEEGNISLLDALPLQYLTDSNLDKIIEKNINDSWGNFDLSRIPRNARKQNVCLCAVKMKVDNFIHVPEEERSEAIIEKVVGSINSYMHYLPLIPSRFWTKEKLYKAINSLYSNYSKYSDRVNPGYYFSGKPSTASAMCRIQVLLTFVPKEVKDRSFYLGLFDNTRLSFDDLALIIPNKYKQHPYYHQVSIYDIKKVPEKYLTKKMFEELINQKEKSAIEHIFKKAPALVNKYLNEKFADSLIEISVDFFTKLPLSYQTQTRLIKAIKLEGNESKSVFATPFTFVEKRKELLTIAVCEAFIEKGAWIPKIPNYFWDEAFVWFCRRKGHSSEWFKQLPKHFQNADIVAEALRADIKNIKYANPQFIKEEFAIKLFRDSLKGSHKDEVKYIPKHYFQGFKEMTGLPQNFYGGEVSFNNLKQDHNSNTYCKLGDCYIGTYYNENSRPKLIMTRRSPFNMIPEIVFDEYIGTYHKTWLEKLITDHLPNYTKPKVSKELKDLQLSSYFTIQKECKHNGVEVYKVTFLGEVMAYTAWYNWLITNKDKNIVLNFLDQAVKAKETSQAS